ncbi:MAG: hypothetical protein PHO37_05970 [Kiritimatiellae bacterium]|nr:hypothetical protein [Kiritimatiellia bacterium]
MKSELIIYLLLGVLGAGALAEGASVDLQSDTWVAIDALGRALPAGEKTGGLRPDRCVGVFYYIWHGAHGYSNEGGGHDQNKVKVPVGKDLEAPYDITKILQQPKDQRQWGPVNRFHHWGEPLFGYYVANDDWVIRRHAQMLSDVGVDVILFDVTNGFTYREISFNLMRVYSEIRSAGGRTPQIAFLCNGSLIKAARGAAATLWRDLYQPAKYPELWFQWKGKPLILGDPEAFTDEMKAFFSIRNSWAWSRGGRNEPTRWFGNGKDCWNWLDNTPQNYGWHDSPEKPEQVPVATAQHPHPDKGKSYCNGKPMHPPETEQGHYFAEQWQRALEIDPEFILITQWNEWVAQRFINKGEKHFEMYAGEPNHVGDSVFIDVYTQEYNRDIEPMKGGHGDNYYYQMAANIRKFKGARPAPQAGPLRHIDLAAGLEQWNAVEPTYRDTLQDTTARDHHGWGGAGPYRDASGRNDFVLAKVARDDTTLFFMVQTQQPVSPPAGENWMELFVAASGSDAPAWEGFHYRIRLEDVNQKLYAVERCGGGFKWIKCGSAQFVVADNTLQLALPRALLGKCAAEESLDLCFKWSDNRMTTEAIDWLRFGDTAPNARFMYRYKKNVDIR